MTPHEAMQRIDALASHVWLVRTFLKHSEEAEEDESLLEIVRDLYDYCLALGPAWDAQDSAEYLNVAHKKFTRLRRATDKYVAVYPEISAHTNFKMAARSLETAVNDIAIILDEVRANG